NNNMLLFNLYVELDDFVLNSTQYEAKNVVKLIVDEIEKFDEYDWVFTIESEILLSYYRVGLFYLLYSQCWKLKYKHKESN
ncbi:19301_t:CDS:1, partial [Cetraspora pellucida]